MTRHRIRSIAVVVVVGALVVVGLWRQVGRSADGVELDSGWRVLLGTFGRVQLRCADRQTGERALAAAFAALGQVDGRLSTYREDSELAEVNRQAADGPVGVSAETFELLRRAAEHGRMSGGAFDITVGPMLAVWKQAGQEGRWPGAAELAEAKSKVGYKKVVLRDGQRPTVRFATSGMWLNVDAIGKGYAVDCALEAVRGPGVRAALVEIGGEIACFGEYRDGAPWRIGIQDPFADDDSGQVCAKARWVVELRDCAAATSGNYRQYTMIDGRRASHIVDPRTGLPAEVLASVTIIAPRAADADALATAVSVLGLEQGMALVESLPGTEAFLVAGDAENTELYRSSGFAHFESDGGGSGR